MVIAIRSGDALLAAYDLDTLSQTIPKVELFDCPACGKKPLLAREGNAWYIVGMNPACETCGHTWRLPSESEADDLRTKGEK